MRAALLHGPRRLQVAELERPTAPPGWCLVRTELVGICGTDKAFYVGTYPLLKRPLVPGHEVVGVVEEGPLRGLRVVSEINFPCWTCGTCRAGRYTHCPRKRTLGIDFDGGMAELFAAPPEALHPFHGPPEAGIFAEPLAAILRALSLRPPVPGDRAAVVGTGSLAWLAVQVLKRLYGLQVDVVARRHSAKAHRFKAVADAVVTPDEAEEYDVVFEASGDPSALELAVRLARPMGVVHLKSTPGSGAPLNLTPAVVKEVQVVTSRCGTSREFELAVRLLASGIVEARPDAVYGLIEAPAAFEASLGPPLKVAVRP